jgi:hypothetical protein
MLILKRDTKRTKRNALLCAHLLHRIGCSKLFH